MTAGSRSSLIFRRTGYAANLALFFVALLTIAVVVNYFARRPGLRLKLDATKTRAYSLSEQTKLLLDDLDGDWTIALITVEDAADPASRQQVNEVLERYRDASPAISIVRVDPTDPQTLGEYETLLARLRDLESDRIIAYETALDDGAAAFRELQLFAQQQSAQLTQALSHLDADDPTRAEIEQGLGLLGLLGSEGDQVLDAVRTARQVSESQPIPDYESARSILGQALSRMADELYELSRVCATWRERGEAAPVVSRFARSAAPEYERTAQRLAVAADPLMRLPELEMASIGRQLQRGEAAVIVGPTRSAVVPSAQLFPKLNVREVGDATVAFDRRFRGEQVISAAIRSLLVPQMPMVVFVHAEERSLLRENKQRADLVGMTSLLKASRFDVREWSVASTQRPVGEPGQPVVWIIVPPSSRDELEPGREELSLVRAAEILIADGEAVMLNVYPSLLPRYRRDDPWAVVSRPFGVQPRTSEAIFEAVLVGEDLEYQNGQAVDQFPHDHLICSAVHGQQAYFVLPVPLEQVDAGGAVDVIAAVSPDPYRWLEPDWERKMVSREEVERLDPFAEALPIVVTAERTKPVDGGRQRFMLVGSGGWMLSYVADVYASIGGSRVVLTNPGNSELMLAAVAWLAGMDDLIAPSPVSRQVARLDGLDGGARFTWGLATVLGLPLACLLLGAFVTFTRRL